MEGLSYVPHSIKPDCRLSLRESGDSFAELTHKSFFGLAASHSACLRVNSAA